LQKQLSISAFCAIALLLQGCGSKVDCNGNKVKENAIVNRHDNRRHS
jgi:protein involved in sex pheromone biosynthesis